MQNSAIAHVGTRAARRNSLRISACTPFSMAS